MTVTFEHARKSDVAPAAAPGTKTVAIKGAVAGLWPPAMLGLGLLLTLAWSSSLLWLFAQTILALL